MRFTITGADRQTGRDAQLTLAAASAEEAERLATQKGMLVASVRTETAGGDGGDDDSGALPLWDVDPGHPAEAAASPGLPATLVGTNDGEHAAPAAAGATAQYHVIQNPALYLLETAVTKHMREGWEPLGGIQVNNWNNQMQFYQALVRRPRGQA